MEQKKNTSFFTTIRPFIFGGVSGMTATAIIQPVDMLKVRIQIQAEENGRYHIHSDSKRPTSPFSNLLPLWPFLTTV